jgi:hypothetical protein
MTDEKRPPRNRNMLQSNESAGTSGSGARRLDRTEAAERIVEEMASRQGHRTGPYFNWNLATETFRLRFETAWMEAAPLGVLESVESFARAFVDAWPEGAAALRIVPDQYDPIANPPYSQGGLWPAFLRRS